jgi:IS5 family transposase
LLVAQHVYAWSYQETVKRVADSLVRRWFCRVYFQRVSTKATLLRGTATIRPAPLHALVDRVALLARQAKAPQARTLRIDSTCVQTTIHHPTDSGPLGDGVCVLCRLIRQTQPLVQSSLARVRDVFRSRLRTSRRLLQHIHRVDQALHHGRARSAARIVVGPPPAATRDGASPAQRSPLAHARA